MICTESFTFNSPFEQFKKSLVNAYDNHEIEYNDKIIERNAKKLWQRYGKDVLAFIDGKLGDPELNWDNEAEVCKAILNQYVENAKNEPEIVISFETYWSDLMLEAMERNAPNLFGTDFPCNMRGETVWF